MSNPRIQLFKRPGRPYWFARYYDHAGRRQRESTGCASRRAAEVWAARRESELADPAHATADAATIRTAVELLVNRRAEEARAGLRSVATVRFYQSKGGHLLRVFGEGFALRNLTARAVDGFISTRRAEGASENTIHKELVTIRATLKLAKRAGLWLGDLDVVLPHGFSPRYEPRSRYLTREELQRLLGSLPADHAARVAAIVATSARWSESSRLRREDVAADLSAVHVPGSKTERSDRVVPIVAIWQRDLLAYAMEHADGTAGLLFRPWGNVGRDLPAACEAAGIARCTPNDLRRTCGTWLRGAGVPAEIIGQVVMGHADSRMVERVYGRLSPADARALLARALGEEGARAGSGRGQTGSFQADSTDSADSAPQGTSTVSVPRGGIEPPTRGFSVLCSTD